MPVITATELEPDRAERNIKLIMHDQQPVRRDLVEAAERGDGTAGTVHVRLRLAQRDRNPGQPADGDRRAVSGPA